MYCSVACLSHLVCARIQKVVFAGKPLPDLQNLLESYRRSKLEARALHTTCPPHVKKITSIACAMCQDFTKQVTVAEDILSSHVRRALECIYVYSSSMCWVGSKCTCFTSGKASEKRKREKEEKKKQKETGVEGELEEQQEEAAPQNPEEVWPEETWPEDAAWNGEEPPAKRVRG